MRHRLHFGEIFLWRSNVLLVKWDIFHTSRTLGGWQSEYVNPYNPLRNITVVICSHQADSPFTCGLMSAMLVTYHQRYVYGYTLRRIISLLRPGVIQKHNTKNLKLKTLKKITKTKTKISHGQCSFNYGLGAEAKHIH